MGATTSDLKIRIILNKFVPINFFDAKKQPNPIFRFFAFTHKINNYYKDVRKELDLSLQITRTNNLDVY